MIDLRSVWRKQIKLVTVAPISEILIVGEDKVVSVLGILVIIRNRPYPPSFRRIPARIIDPATGASTWALGNQRWTRNRGSLTKKAKRVNNLMIKGLMFAGIVRFG